MHCHLTVHWTKINYKQLIIAEQKQKDKNQKLNGICEIYHVHAIEESEDKYSMPYKKGK